MVSPHVTFISKEMPSFYFEPNSINSVFPKWMDILLSTSHPFREESSLPSYSSILLTSLPETKLSFMALYMCQVLHIVDFLGSRLMETAPTSIEVLLRPTQSQSDEPSDLRGSLSPAIVYTAPGSPRRSPIHL